VASDLLLPLDALRRVRFLSRLRSLSAPSLAAPDFSFTRCLLLSSSFLLVGDGALQAEQEAHGGRFDNVHATFLKSQ